jgi:hypothetical protein
VGIERAQCLWLRSYLTGRIQGIKSGDAFSEDIRVTSGVPQGSHLGPLFFIWFVNRVSVFFDYVRVQFYSDDMKLFLPLRGFQDCMKIQPNLKKLKKGFCDAGIYQKTFIRVQRYVHSEVSLHVIGSSEAAVRQLYMEPIL